MHVYAYSIDVSWIIEHTQARQNMRLHLVEGGKLIGAIGCSGGTGSQDETICTVGANTINK
jgi:hypothetical protein